MVPRACPRGSTLDGVEASFIDELSKVKKIEKITGDVIKIETLKEVVKDVDIVFHMAGIIHPKKISQFFQINTLGTKNMLKLSSESGVKRFIYISSNSAVGTNKSHHRLMTEEDGPNPYLNYGLSKYYAERIVKNFQERLLAENIANVILRECFNVQK